MTFLRRSVLLFLASLPALPAAAAGLTSPRGRILLTVGGAISATNTEDSAQFDRAMLEALDWREIESFTHYTDGLQQFAGPTLASLMKTLGVSAGSLQLTALDDYTIDIPFADMAEHEIILAMEQNGKRMRVRDRGPIWIVYPASSPGKIGDKHISHMIWQLKSINISQ